MYLARLLEFIVDAMIPTVVGALTGLVVGWFFFGPAILRVAGQLGLHHAAMWQLGAFLGFVTGFLRRRQAERRRLTRLDSWRDLVRFVRDRAGMDDRQPA